ncbi:glycoside hydrolase family 43 protein, partial [Glycomyces tenuis]|uniref:glycoside hydrolase family 43 protein n=1 Tax=Glycomyces tenuis TaxID=58116 RepID=UPI000552BF57
MRVRNRRSAIAALAAVALAGLTSLAVVHGAGAEEAPGEVEAAQEAVTNPLLPNGADPWLEYWDGNYYLSATTWDSTVTMRVSPTLAGLSDAPAQVVWDDAGTPNRCCSHWAPEFHRIDGTWYLMYTSGDSQTNFDGQRLHVLRSTGDTPMGPYEFMGTPMPDRWNIDGTYLELDGQLYLLWSEWAGENQSVWIAEMSDPWTVVPGTDTVIAQPEYDWETVGGRVNEAPEVLQHDGDTFVTFSASQCATADYKLGLLTYNGGDPLDRASWPKTPEPVFQQGNGVYTTGHNGFFTSPDGTEHWLVYHGNDDPNGGCGSSRSTRVQPFTFNEDGTPDFGEPVANGVALPPPSGE